MDGCNHSDSGTIIDLPNDWVSKPAEIPAYSIRQEGVMSTRREFLEGTMLLAAGGAASTSLKPIATTNAPKAIGPYSQAVRAGNMLYLSGQIALDPASGNLVEATSQRRRAGSSRI